MRAREEEKILLQRKLFPSQEREKRERNREREAFPLRERGEERDRAREREVTREREARWLLEKSWSEPTMLVQSVHDWHNRVSDT